MDVKMPKLGESVHEGTIEQWLVSEGNHVDEYEPLCEVCLLYTSDAADE